MSAPEPQALKCLVPVRYSAWLAGNLGGALVDQFTKELAGNPGINAKVTRLPRGWLVEHEPDLTDGGLADACIAAARGLEEWVQKTYPIYHHEMGPVWTGTIQVVAS